MAKFGVTKAYRYYADRFYLDRANRDTYLARQAVGDLLTSGHLYLPTKLVKGLDAPGADGDAARKKYVDDLVALYLPLAGGNLSGNLTVDALITIDGVDLSVHVTDPDAHVGEMLATLLGKGRMAFVPTRAGWTGSNVNGGTNPTLMAQENNTSITASSRGMAYVGFVLMGTTIGNSAKADWTKKHYIAFNYARENSDAEAIARVQLKTVYTEGILAASGVGLQVDNLALTGESYRTARSTVDLGVTIVNKQAYHILIIVTPGVSVEFKVDGVSKGTINTAADVPNADNIAAYLVHSIVNGVTGGVNAWSYISPIWIWRAL